MMSEKTKEILTSKMHLAAVIISISVIISAGAYFYFSYEEASILSDANKQLESVAFLKASQISDWNKERFSDAKIFSQSSFFKSDISKWTEAKQNPLFKKKLIEDLSIMNANDAYSNVLLADTKERLIAALTPGFNQIDSTTIFFLKKALKEKRIISSDLYYCDIHKQIHLDYIAPVLSKDNAVIALLVLRVNPNDLLYPLIKIWPVSRQSSESLIVEKAGNEVIYLNRLRNENNFKLNLRVPLTKKEIPAVQAALGLTGKFEGTGYTGKRVEAYIKPVNGTPWIMITQVDKSEIFAGIYFREGVTAVFTLLLILVLTLGLVWYYHYRQRNIYRDLFDREKQLRESHEEFKTILYSIGDGVITADINGNVKKMNTAAENLTGWKESEAYGKSVEDVFKILNEETREEKSNPVHRVLKEGAVVGLANHSLLISRDGKSTPIADSGSPIRNEKGKIEGVVLVFRDKTEEHRAEKLIRQSEARLNRAELASNSGNWELHLETKTMIASEGAAKVYGVYGKELGYEVVKKIPLPEYRNLLDEALKNLIEKNTPYDIEFKIKAQDTGQIKDIHSIAQYDKETKVLFGVIQDITKRKKAEEAVKANEEFLNNMLETVPVPVFYKDRKGNYIGANKAFYSLFGYSKTDFSGKNVFDLYPKELAEIYYSKDNELMEEGGVQIYESHFPDSNGFEHEVILHKAAYYTSENKIGGLIGAILDITERKKDEEIIKRNKERWESLFNNSPAAIAVYREVNEGEDFIFTDFNLTAQKTDTINRRDVIGKKISDVFPSSEKLGFLDVFRKVWRTGQTEHMSFYYKDERMEGWRENIIYKLNTGEIVAIYNDVTERMKAEIALRESEELFRTTLYSIGDGVITTDENGLVNKINPIAESLTGWKESDAKNKHLYEVFDIINEESRIKVESPVDRVLREGKIIGLANHTILLSKNGGEIPIADSGAPIKNEKGEITGVVLVFRDQLKEREGQKKLEESERQLRQSQRVARVGYYMLDVKTGNWISSEMLDELFGIDANYSKDVEGWLNLVHPQQREEMMTYFTDYVISKKKEFNKEYRVLRSGDGRELWVHGLGELEFDSKGQVVKMFGTIQDITERKKIQAEILTSLKEKETLLKEVHHRVKNNFQQIISLIYLQSETIQDKNILGILEDLQNRLRAMSLIHQLMYNTGNFSQIDAKDYIYKLTQHLLQTYSSGDHIKLNLNLESHSLNINTVIPCGLIINEIITNSLKYAFPGRADGQIDITFYKEGDEYSLILSDNGIGVKDEIEIENVSTLGLRLVNLLIKQLKGKLNIYRPEKGLKYEMKFKGAK